MHGSAKLKVDLSHRLCEQVHLDVTKLSTAFNQLTDNRKIKVNKEKMRRLVDELIRLHYNIKYLHESHTKLIDNQFGEIQGIAIKHIKKPYDNIFSIKDDNVKARNENEQ
jgi:hypothetical protein